MSLPQCDMSETSDFVYKSYHEYVRLTCRIRRAGTCHGRGEKKQAKILCKKRASIFLSLAMVACSLSTLNLQRVESKPEFSKEGFHLEGVLH